MKILVTGTHFTPAQAVIEEMVKIPGVKVVYVGRLYTREGDKTPSVESQVIPTMGIKFIPLTSGRWQRKFTRYTIPSLLKIPIGLAQSMFILLKEKPQVVLSFGGYLSVPVIFAAWLLSVPIIIHEQTLVSSLANKIGAFFAGKIAVSFDHSPWQKDPRVILTGNPIRKELLMENESKITANKQTLTFLQNAQAEKMPVILITAGNQGSHTINLAVKEAVSKLTGIAYVVHQTGDSKYDDYNKLIEKRSALSHPERYLVEKWIEAADFGLLLRKVKLVVGRGGINTLLELAHFAVPALVIPIDFLPEQRVNAKYFTEVGLAQTLFQKDLTPGSLYDSVREMLEAKKEIKAKTKTAQRLVVTDSAQRLTLETLLLAQK